MSVTFRLTPHDIRPGVSVCEIWVGDKMVGVVYPQEPNAVRLISSHIEGKEGDLQVIRFEP
jgi:hypothetical protein